MFFLGGGGILHYLNFTDKYVEATTDIISATLYEVESDVLYHLQKCH